MTAVILSYERLCKILSCANKLSFYSTLFYSILLVERGAHVIDDQ